MKKIFLLSICSIVLCSCGGGSGADHDVNLDSIRTHFIPNLDGVWVMNDYLQAIEENNSPRKSWDTLKGAVAIVLSKFSMRNDSLVGGVNWNNHEASAFNVFFRYGEGHDQLQTDLAKREGKKGMVNIGYQLTESGKLFLVLYEYDENRKLLGQRFFKKVMDKQMDEDMSAGIDHAVNLRLFKGKFAYTNEAGKPDTVEFREDGKMKGFEGSKFYFIRTDFNDAYSNVDVVSFFKDENTERGYGFQLVAGNIDLYKLDSIHDKGELAYGKKMFSLIRQPE